jgi:hypothetical protein
MGFKDYITEFAIEKELQALANAFQPQSSSESLSYRAGKKNMDSIFT